MEGVERLLDNLKLLVAERRSIISIPNLRRSNEASILFLVGLSLLYAYHISQSVLMLLQ